MVSFPFFNRTNKTQKMVAPTRVSEKQRRCRGYDKAWAAYLAELPDPFAVANGVNDNVKVNPVRACIETGVYFLFGDEVRFEISPSRSAELGKKPGAAGPPPPHGAPGAPGTFGKDAQGKPVGGKPPFGKPGDPHGDPHGDPKAQGAPHPDAPAPGKGPNPQGDPHADPQAQHGAPDAHGQPHGQPGAKPGFPPKKKGEFPGQPGQPPHDGPPGAQFAPQGPPVEADPEWLIDLHKFWKANRQKSFLHQIGLSGGIFGDVFVKIFPDGAGSKGDLPKIQYLDPANVDVVTDPEDYTKVEAFLIEYVIEEDDGMRRTRTQEITPMYPDDEPLEGNVVGATPDQQDAQNKSVAGKFGAMSQSNGGGGQTTPQASKDQQPKAKDSKGMGGPNLTTQGKNDPQDPNAPEENPEDKVYDKGEAAPVEKGIQLFKAPDRPTSWVIRDFEQMWDVYDGVYTAKPDSKRQVGPTKIWPYEWPPIEHCSNVEVPHMFWGLPDVDESSVELVETIQRTMSHLTKVVRFHGSPLMFAKGLMPELASEIDVSPENIITFPAGGGVDPDLKVLEALGNVASFVDYVNKLQKDLFRQIGVPPIALGELDNMASQLGGINMSVMFGPIVQKTELKRISYGDLIDRLNRKVLILMGHENEDEYEDLEIVWPESMPGSAYLERQTLAEDMKMGLSKRTALQRLKYDPDKEMSQSSSENYSQMAMDAEFAPPDQFGDKPGSGGNNNPTGRGNPHGSLGATGNTTPKDKVNPSTTPGRGGPPKS